ncbi:MAG: glycoside hydrolase family 5 protein [Thermoproteota archaeon]|nr:glycoside hydrolase family 5 protein [Candidatus Brockarchaeota archaeon]
MQRFKIVFVILISLCIIPTGFANTFGEDSPTRFTLTNQSGSAATSLRMRRGINIGNALEAPQEGAWGVYIEDEYFRIIKEAGFDTVRIPIRWSVHAESYPPYRIYEDFFQRVDHVVSKALEQNLITIINIHHYEEIMYNPEYHRERFIAIWRQIAEHYKDYPETLCFELLNEPSYNLVDRIWNELVAETVRVIRESNPTRKIIIGPTRWNSVYKLEALKLPEDENIIVTFHFYTPFEFTHQGAEWVSPSPPTGKKWIGTEDEKKQIRDELDIAVKWAGKHGNITLFMGEFGAYGKADMDSRIRWTSFVVKEAEKRNIAWCYWEFCSGFGAYDPVTKKWREGLLNALTSSKHYVSVETDGGSILGAGWYEEGSYATIRVVETSIGFPVPSIFDHFEGLRPEDRLIDISVVELYVDGPRVIKAVWRKDYTLLLVIVVTMCIIAVAAAFLYRSRIKAK